MLCNKILCYELEFCALQWNVELCRGVLCSLVEWSDFNGALCSAVLQLQFCNVKPSALQCSEVVKPCALQCMSPLQDVPCQAAALKPSAGTAPKKLGIWTENMMILLLYLKNYFI